MDATGFWELVDKSREAGGGIVGQHRFLRHALEQSVPSEISDFNSHLEQAMRAAYNWNLQAAAWVIGCGQSSDGFVDFCAWLVAQGQATFQAALETPDVLASIEAQDDPLEDWLFPELLHLAGDIHEAKTGRDLLAPLVHFDDIELAGAECDWEVVAVQQRVPQLWTRYGNRKSLPSGLHVPGDRFEA